MIQIASPFILPKSSCYCSSPGTRFKRRSSSCSGEFTDVRTVALAAMTPYTWAERDADNEKKICMLYKLCPGARVLECCNRRRTLDKAVGYMYTINK